MERRIYRDEHYAIARKTARKYVESRYFENGFDNLIDKIDKLESFNTTEGGHLSDYLHTDYFELLEHEYIYNRILRVLENSDRRTDSIYDTSVMGHFEKIQKENISSRNFKKVIDLMYDFKEHIDETLPKVFKYDVEEVIFDLIKKARIRYLDLGYKRVRYSGEYPIFHNIDLEKLYDSIEDHVVYWFIINKGD